MLKNSVKNSFWIAIAFCLRNAHVIRARPTLRFKIRSPPAAL